MELEERLLYISLRIKKLGEQIRQQNAAIKQLEKENNILKEENEALKKINFEQKKKIEIADIANQLGEESHNSDEIKRKLDKYIREVDAVIQALKKME